MDCAALYKREIRLERLEIIKLRSDLIQKAEFRTFINYPNLWVSLLSISDYRNLSQKAISVLVRLPTRGVTRLYGARGKKQIWRPYGRIWVFSKANLLYWRKYLWHCWDFSAPPEVIQRPQGELAPEELCPPCPPRYAPAANNLLFASKDFLPLSKWNQKRETQRRMLI